MPQLVKNATVREEILQGMITSFQLEGIKISQETAYYFGAGGFEA